jgi:hypothetical protein
MTEESDSSWHTLRKGWDGDVRSDDGRPRDATRYLGKTKLDISRIAVKWSNGKLVESVEVW